jgi:hypothetical protein
MVLVSLVYGTIRRVCLFKSSIAARPKVLAARLVRSSIFEGRWVVTECKWQNHCFSTRPFRTGIAFH